MPKIILIRGPLGIGKTTIAKELTERLNAAYFSMDKILEENNIDKIDEKQGCIPKENFIKADNLILPEIKKAIGQGKNIILDGCFYHQEQIEHLKEELKDNKILIFNLKASLESCIKRDRKRKRVYGEEAARAVHKLVSRFDIGESIDTDGKSEEQVLGEILGVLRVLKR
jgi:shikimate kinase